MRKLLIILLLLLPLDILAQSVISGKVTDGSNNEVIEGLIVRLRVGEKDLSYDLTNSDGIFRLECSSSAKEVELVFSLISYKTKSLTVENKTQYIPVEMEVEATQIKEVSISAPKIQLRGDTISYNLSAFKGKNDVTLEDALKKLPGVEVAESGEISYMGKDISKFYVEDLDLLGGRYSVATTNITADMVATVEVMENYQPIKMLQGKSISDDVAMNIRLKEKAKLKPSGNIEG